MALAVWKQRSIYYRRTEC